MPVTQRFLQTLEAMEPKIIPSYLNIRDGEGKETLTMEIQIEREMIIPEGQKRGGNPGGSPGGNDPDDNTDGDEDDGSPNGDGYSAKGSSNMHCSLTDLLPGLSK